MVVYGPYLCEYHILCIFKLTKQDLVLVHVFTAIAIMEHLNYL